MKLMRIAAPVLAVLLVAAAPASDPQIDAMAKRFVAAADSMRPQGIDPSDYFMRLAYLEQRISSTPPGAPAQMLSDLQAQKTLEFQLDERLISGKALELPSPGTATVRLFETSARHPDPIGVYVPQPDPNGRYSLVVLLHGAQETETDVISRQVFRHLADSRHAILIAPYNGGNASWQGSSIGDLLMLVDKMRKLYSIDKQGMYLVGISMGGASAFRVVERDADRFAAVMTVVGSLDGDDAKAARLALRDRRVYMVSGGVDPIMTPAVESRSYASLARGCVAVSQYVAPLAGHDLYGTSNQVERAWNDMFDGVIRNSDTRECGETPGT